MESEILTTNQTASHKNMLINTLRWICVLPGALAGALATAVIILCITFIGDFLDGEIYLMLEYPDVYLTMSWWRPILFWSIIAGCFVCYGNFIAPSLKKPTTIALSIIIGTLMGIGLIISILVHKWLLVISFTMAIVIAVVTAINLSTEQ